MCFKKLHLTQALSHSKSFPLRVFIGVEAAHGMFLKIVHHRITFPFFAKVPFQFILLINPNLVRDVAFLRPGRERGQEGYLPCLDS
jgi:hypothetical protein